MPRAKLVRPKESVLKRKGINTGSLIIMVVIKDYERCGLCGYRPDDTLQAVGLPEQL